MRCIARGWIVLVVGCALPAAANVTQQDVVATLPAGNVTTAAAAVQGEQPEQDCSSSAERRLTSVGSPLTLSESYVGNVAVAVLDSTRAVVAFHDYAAGRRGRLATCQLVSDALACSAATQFTNKPVAVAAGSLAIAAVSNRRVVVAWKEGGTPYVGHVQLCMADMTACGPELVVRAEWSAVAVAVFSPSSLMFAYIDKQMSHRGEARLCDVAGLDLLCNTGQIFESRPLSSLSMLALGATTSTFFEPSGELVFAYEVYDETSGVYGQLLPCRVKAQTLNCYPLAAVRYAPGRSDGSTLSALSSQLFVVAYADRHPVCPRPTSQRRRREQHVCTLADGHPTIAKGRACRMAFTGLSLQPALECSEPFVIDDGYTTHLPSIAVRNGSSFATAYGCSGCGDMGSRGLLRECQVPADVAAGMIGSFIGNISCGSEVVLSNVTTLWAAVAIVGNGFLVAYGDYGGARAGVARLVG